MFWKLIEIVVRIIYWRRFSKAKKIGEAATLLSNGNAKAALAHLERHGNGVHQTLIPLFAFTQAKIYDALGRSCDAENSYKAVVLTNPKDSRADLELAILTGRQFRFEDCRIWLHRAIDKEDDEIRNRAKEILQHLDAIERGAIQAEYEKRAKQMAAKIIDDGRALGIPPDTKRIEQWLAHSKAAHQFVDDLALLLAFGEVQNGGQWKIGLAIEDTHVITADGRDFHPFQILEPMLCATASMS